MIRPDERTLVVVADAGGAVLYLHAKPGAALTLHSAVDAGPAVHQHSHELGQDKPARIFQSVGGARHAAEPRVDLHRRAKMDFAAELARQVDSAVEAEACTALILVAPARMLGDLRSRMAEGTAARVTGEIVKDLRHRPLHQLIDALGSELDLKVRP